MATRSRQPPDPGSLSSLLMTLTALSGEVPVSQVCRLSEAQAYREKVLKALKEKGLLRTYFCNGLRGLRLTAKGKQWLLTNWPDRFEALFIGDTVTNAPKYMIPQRLRLHRMAEVLTTMLHADISSFPWEKPAVFQPTPPPADTYISRPAYYSSREVKEIGPQSAKIRGSRATGVLLTDGGIFLVYNTADSQMKWEYKAEMRLKALLQMEVCRSRLSTQFSDLHINANVYGVRLAQMEVLMGPGNTATHSYFVLDGSLEHFHYLTNDRRGEVILRLLCDPVLKGELDGLLSEDLTECRPGWTIENDGFDEAGAPVLFGYTCDMPRIRRFDTALELYEQDGTLICFDFQEEALRRICGPRITFQGIDFEAIERSASLYHASS